MSLKPNHSIVIESEYQVLKRCKCGAPLLVWKGRRTCLEGKWSVGEENGKLVWIAQCSRCQAKTVVPDLIGLCHKTDQSSPNHQAVVVVREKPVRPKT